MPKLLDFGAARLLNPELGAGVMEPSEHRLRLFTPEFASPEQLLGEGLTPASDVYSLGLLLYTLLTGERLHRGGEISAEWRSGRTSTQALPEPSERAPPRRLHGDLDSILSMATQDDARQRYKSIDLLAEDIACYLARRPVGARPATLSYRTGRLLRRNAGLTAMALLTVCSLSGAALLAARGAGGRVQSPPGSSAHLPAFGDNRRAAAQIGGALGPVGLLARQGDKEAQLALPLLYWAQGHLLMSAGQHSDAMHCFRQGAEARRAAPPLPWVARSEAPTANPLPVDSPARPAPP